MKIEVEQQTKRFYLAFEEWKPVVGHEIKIGDYNFCAIPVDDVINISEVTSGLKLLEIPMTFEISLVTSTKEDTMEFLYRVGKVVRRKINQEKNFNKLLSDMRSTAISKLGEMPKIEAVDTDWVFEEESDVLN